MDGYRTLGRLGLVLGLVGVEMYLAHDITQTGSVIGYTLTKSFTVAPTRKAKVKTVAVQVGASVTTGQTIAELDSTELDNELDAARAERERSIAAIQAAITKLRRENVDFARRFEFGAERASAQLVIAEASSHTAAAELAAVEAEIKDQKELVEKHLANVSVVNDLELRRAALAQQVQAAGQTLGVLRGNVTAAQTRNTGIDADASLDSVLAPLEAQVRSAELKVGQLERDHDALVLHAPVDGVVDQLPLHPGDLAGPESAGRHGRRRRYQARGRVHSGSACEPGRRRLRGVVDLGIRPREGRWRGRIVDERDRAVADPVSGAGQ
ncbi:MAG: biotin/lipoyl-binding protein [Kofleriaceae bacterium]